MIREWAARASAARAGVPSRFRPGIPSRSSASLCRSGSARSSTGRSRSRRSPRSWAQDVRTTAGAERRGLAARRGSISAGSTSGSGSGASSLADARVEVHVRRSRARRTASPRRRRRPATTLTSASGASVRRIRSTPRTGPTASASAAADDRQRGDLQPVRGARAGRFAAGAPSAGWCLELDDRARSAPSARRARSAIGDQEHRRVSSETTTTAISERAEQRPHAVEREPVGVDRPDRAALRRARPAPGPSPPGRARAPASVSVVPRATTSRTSRRWRPRRRLSTPRSRGVATINVCRSATTIEIGSSTRPIPRKRPAPPTYIRSEAERICPQARRRARRSGAAGRPRRPREPRTTSDDEHARARRARAGGLSTRPLQGLRAAWRWRRRRSRSPRSRARRRRAPRSSWSRQPSDHAIGSVHCVFRFGPGGAVEERAAGARPSGPRSRSRGTSSRAAVGSLGIVSTVGPQVDVSGRVVSSQPTPCSAELPR